VPDQVAVLTIYVMPVVVSVVATWLTVFVWFRILFRLPQTEAHSAIAISTVQHVGDIGFACLLAWIMFRTGMRTIVEGIVLAFAVWACFVTAVAGHMYAFRSFTLRFFSVTAGSVLVALLTIGIVLGVLIR
jgi:hypothetical protein